MLGSENLLNAGQFTYKLRLFLLGDNQDGREQKKPDSGPLHTVEQRQFKIDLLMVMKASAPHAIND